MRTGDLSVGNAEAFFFFFIKGREVWEEGGRGERLTQAATLLRLHVFLLGQRGGDRPGGGGLSDFFQETIRPPSLSQPPIKDNLAKFGMLATPSDQM